MRDPCDRFVGQALQRVYGLSDFADDGGAPLTTAAVADSLMAGAWPSWTRLATLENGADAASLQAALHAVAAHTEGGGPVVALYRPATGRSQLALVLPRRRMGASVTLRGAVAPRVACVIRGRSRAVVDALLSYCFLRAQRPIQLFARTSGSVLPPSLGAP